MTFNHIGDHRYPFCYFGAIDDLALGAIGACIGELRSSIPIGAIGELMSTDRTFAVAD